MAEYDNDYSKQEFDKMLKANPGINYHDNHNLYVGPLTKLSYAYGLRNSGLNGYVSPDAPMTANVGILRPSTAAHEAAHTQQNAAKFYDISQPQNYYSPAGKEAVPGINALLEQLRAKYPNLVGDNLGDSSREIMANLQGIEASLPTGTNVLDTLDLPSAYRRLVEHRMFPQSDKFFASDYTPPSKPLQSNESILQYLRRRMKGR